MTLWIWECFWHCFIHFLYYYSIRLIHAIWFCVLSSLCLFFCLPACFLTFLLFSTFHWKLFQLGVLVIPLSPQSSVLGNSFFCFAFKWICVFIIAVDCNIWKELHKNIQMVSGVCCSVISVQGQTGETMRATPAGLTCCSPSSPLLVVASLGLFLILLARALSVCSLRQRLGCFPLSLALFLLSAGWTGAQVCFAVS